MPSYFLEGESFFVLSKLDSLIENKKIELNPENNTSPFSLLKKTDYYVYIDPNKENIEQIHSENFIVCFLGSLFAYFYFCFIFILV